MKTKNITISKINENEELLTINGFEFVRNNKELSFNYNDEPDVKTYFNVANLNIEKDMWIVDRVYKREEDMDFYKAIVTAIKLTI